MSFRLGLLAILTVIAAFGQADTGELRLTVRDASGNDATPIGKCVIRDLPPGLPARTPIDVTFRYGQNGRLTVKARLPDLNKEATSEIQRSTGMTVEVMKNWNERIQKDDGPLKMS